MPARVASPRCCHLRRPHPLPLIAPAASRSRAGCSTQCADWPRGSPASCLEHRSHGGLTTWHTWRFSRLLKPSLTLCDGDTELRVGSLSPQHAAAGGVFCSVPRDGCVADGSGRSKEF